MASPGVIYTWPRFWRRGLAAAGVSVLCRRACAAAADHVQLSVVQEMRGQLSFLAISPFGGTPRPR
jgi:hypothetical protein